MIASENVKSLATSVLSTEAEALKKSCDSIDESFLKAALDAKVSFRDKSLYWSHGKCDTLKNSKTTLFPAF